MHHDINLLSSENGGDNSPASRGAENRGGRPGGSPGHLAECPCCGGPAGLLGRSLGHRAVRAAVTRDQGGRLHRPGATGHDFCNTAPFPVDQGAGQPQRSLPLRGQECAGLPGQVEALPRGCEARLEAMRASFDVAASRRSLAGWFIDRAFDGTPLEGSSYGWPLPWHRSILLKIGARGFVFELWLRRLWITAVDKLSSAYTLSTVTGAAQAAPPGTSQPAMVTASRSFKEIHAHFDDQALRRMRRRRRLEPVGVRRPCPEDDIFSDRVPEGASNVRSHPGSLEG